MVLTIKVTGLGLGFGAGLGVGLKCNYTKKGVHIDHFFFLKKKKV